MSKLEPTRTYSNLTATERLRALLDERGVEHYDGTETTLWLKDEHGYRASADELTSGRMSVHIWCDTPEQAIAATLGAGTCRKLPPDNGMTCIVRSRGFEMEFGYWKCSECGTNCFEGARYCMGCGRKVEGDG